MSELQKHSDETVEQIAVEFSKIIRNWLGDEKFRELCQRTIQGVRPGFCHSHDYCDANMAMDEAVQTILGRPMTMPSDVEEGRASEQRHDRDLDLWERAWNRAKQCVFYSGHMVIPKKPIDDDTLALAHKFVKVADAYDDDDPAEYIDLEVDLLKRLANFGHDLCEGDEFESHRAYCLKATPPEIARATLDLCLRLYDSASVTVDPVHRDPVVRESIKVDFSPAFLCSWNDADIVEIHSRESLIAEYTQSGLFDNDPDAMGWFLPDEPELLSFADILNYLCEDDNFGEEITNDNMTIRRIK